MSAEVALANQIKPYGMRMINGDDFDGNSMVDVTDDIVNERVETGTTHIHDIFGDTSAMSTYQFDGDATDLGGTYDGTLSNYDTIAGKFGDTILSTGILSQMSTSYVIPTQDDYSLSLWFKQSVNNELVLSNGRCVTAYASITIQNTNVTFRRYNNIDTGANDILLSIPFPELSLNEWHFISVVKLGLDITVNINNTILTGVLSTNSGVGNYSLVDRGYNRFYDCDLQEGYIGQSFDQLRIFNRALSQAEVDTLYAEKETAIVKDYQLKESTVNTHDVFNDNSIVATYQFDNDVTDLGGVYNGIASNTVSYSAGVYDTSLVLDVNTYVSTSVVLNSCESPILESFTGWVKTGLLFGSDANAVGDRHFIVYRSDGLASIVFTGSYYGQAVDGDNYDAIPCSNNDFVFVAIVKTAPDTFDVYLDGVFSLTTTKKSSTSTFLNYGRHWEGQGDDGNIDQVRIFNRALTADEVTALYNEDVVKMVVLPIH